ncbi:MAG: hypothetical protein R2939_11610 [Kofleriaceae bacterium]
MAARVPAPALALPSPVIATRVVEPPVVVGRLPEAPLVRPAARGPPLG